MGNPGQGGSPGTEDIYSGKKEDSEIWDCRIIHSAGTPRKVKVFVYVGYFDSRTVGISA